MENLILVLIVTLNAFGGAMIYKGLTEYRK